MAKKGAKEVDQRSDAELERELADLEALDRLQREEIAQSLKEEMHPDFSTLDRTLLKNLSNEDTEAGPNALDWLRKRYPGLEVSEYDGRIVAKRPDENEWRVLDPNTGFISKDIARDALDIAAPIGQGVLEGLADAKGAALGLIGGPFGVVAGRAAAGAASAASTESIRQALGKALGINKEVRGDDVKTAAALSALIPLGGTMLKGAYNGTRKVFPVAAEMLTGVPRETVKTAYKRLPELDALDKEGVVGISQRALQKIRGPIAEGVERKGKELAQRIGEAQGLIDVRQGKDQIEQLLGEYQRFKPQIDNPQLNSSISEIQRTFDRLFKTAPRPVEELIAGLPPEKAKEVLRSTKIQVRGTPSTAKNVADILYAGKPNFSTVEFVTEEIPGKLKPSDAWQLQKQIGQAAEMFKLQSQPQFVSPRTAGKTEAGKRLVTGLDRAYDLIGDGLEAATERTTAIPAQTVTKPRSVWQMLTGQKAAEEVIPESTKTTSSNTLKNEYKDFRDFERRFQRHFGNEDSTYSTLTNLNKKSKRVLSDFLEDAKNKYKVDVTDEADLLQAHDFLGERYKPLPSMPISSGGTTSTSRSRLGGAIGLGLGGALGAASSDSDFSSSLPSIGGNAVLGSAILAAAVNPRTLKWSLRRGRELEALGGELNKGGRVSNYGARSAWHLLEPNAPRKLSPFYVEDEDPENGEE